MGWTPVSDRLSPTSAPSSPTRGEPDRRDGGAQAVGLWREFRTPLRPRCPPAGVVEHQVVHGRVQLPGVACRHRALGTGVAGARATSQANAPERLSAPLPGRLPGRSPDVQLHAAGQLSPVARWRRWSPAAATGPGLGAVWAGSRRVLALINQSVGWVDCSIGLAGLGCGPCRKCP